MVHHRIVLAIVPRIVLIIVYQKVTMNVELVLKYQNFKITNLDHLTKHILPEELLQNVRLPTTDSWLQLMFCSLLHQNELFRLKTNILISSRPHYWVDCSISSNGTVNHSWYYCKIVLYYCKEKMNTLYGFNF